MQTRVGSLFLQLCTLWTLAITAPLFELLAKYPDFLAVHGVRGPALVGFALSVATLAPIGLAVTVAVVARVRPVAGQWLFGVLAALLSSCFVAQIADRVITSDAVAAALSVGLGGFFGVLVARHGELRRTLNWGALSLLVFLGAYLTRGPVRQQLAPKAMLVDSSVVPARPTPVVLLILDALPTSSLLDRHGEVDALRFPNFARLRDDGIWFPRHTTVSDVTLKAVPSILTGMMPRETARPTIEDHSQNLFTLLRTSHAVQSSEALTRLDPSRARPLEWRVLLEDTALLCAHAAMPDLLTRRLPSLSGRWRGFWSGGDPQRHDDVLELVARFREFMQQRERNPSRPVLVAVHTILPHAPHHYLPSGQLYSPSGIEPSGEGDTTGLRNHDEWAALHSFQRHLLQLGFTDRLLGELLESIPQYDESLIIVTADHGVSFREQEFGRWVGSANASDILEVPLFVKLPLGVRAAECDSSLTRAVDILPTVAEILGFTPAQPFDGRSVLQGGSGGNEVAGLGFQGAFAFERTVIDHSPTLRRKIDWFADGAWDSIYAPAAYRDLLGQSGDALNIGAVSSVQGTVLESEQAEVAVELVGVVQRPNARQPFPTMAIVADGVVRSVTRPYLATGRALQATWSALLSQPLTSTANAAVELYGIEVDAGSGFLLRPLARGAALASFLELPLGARYLVGVSESGFTRRKPYGRTDYRWTTKHVRLVVPLRPDDRVHSIELDVAQAAPQGTATRLMIGGAVVFDERIPAAGGRFRRPFVPQESSTSLELVLECETFLRDDPDGGPQRPLGIALRGITLSARVIQGPGE